MRGAAQAASEATRPHAPGSLSRRRALGGAHAEAGGGTGCGPSPGRGLGARGAGPCVRRSGADALSHSPSGVSRIVLQLWTQGR